MVYFHGECFGDVILYIDIFWFLAFLSKDNGLHLVVRGSHFCFRSSVFIKYEKLVFKVQFLP